MNFDPFYHRYPSKRNLIYSNNGMVATTHPIAAQAGIEIMKRGGNAFDAAIATAACLVVVEPTSNGLGSDAFAILSKGDVLYGINGSGRSPKKLTREWLMANEIHKIPKFGPIPVTVPGAVGTWVEIINRFGNLTLKEVLSPAIRAANEGVVVQPTVGKYWELANKRYSSILKEDMFKYWFETFTIDGKAPKVGSLIKLEDHARTLEIIGKTNGEDFYRGEIANKISNFMESIGGLLSLDDLMEYKPEWVDPISTNYRGYDIWELPPNGQGITTLMALSILNNMELKDLEDPQSVHNAIEAMKIAFQDGDKIIGDVNNINWMDYTTKEYGLNKINEIGDMASIPEESEYRRGGTVYLSAADKDGNMISYIQSNYMGFGCGLVVPGTGIALQNRGCDFTLKAGHPNTLEPGKRSYHTIIPGFLTKENKSIGPFGVMGGMMQPQGHLQVILNTIDYGLNPQDALDAPRWQWIKGNTIHVEHGFSNSLTGALSRMGHDIVVMHDGGGFGRGQIIFKMEDGSICGGTESRADGYIATY